MILSEIDIALQKPTVSGKYLVKTVSTGPLKREHRFEARLFISHDAKNDKDKYKWDVHNQIVTHWYQEHETYIANGL